MTVQTSAVFLLGRTSQFLAVPPPSPPSPAAAANEDDLCSPIDNLSLEDVASSGALPAGSPSLVPLNGEEGVDEDEPSVSPPVTAPTSSPGSPDLSPCVLSPNTSTFSLASAASTRSSASLSTRLAGAVHVLATEASALKSVAQLYATSPPARDGFHQAVEVIVRTQTAHPPGKLVVVGVGKSGHIGRKLVATFNSLAVSASFLHPTEALHGDLGHIREHDALLFITYSGKTQELVTLLPHIDSALPLIILTSHVTAETCELVRHRNDAAAAATAAAATPLSSSATGRRPSMPPAATILLPAPIPVEEKVSFGVAAPTASTTTALAVGDALAIVTSKELHPSTESVFRRNHPGGAIGAAFQKPAAADAEAHRNTIRYLAIPWDDIPVVRGNSSTESLSRSPPHCADVLRAGYSSTNGWVRVMLANSRGEDGEGVCVTEECIASPSRIRALRSADLARPVHDVPGLVAGRADFIAMAADTKVRKATEWLRAYAEEQQQEQQGLLQATKQDSEDDDADADADDAAALGRGMVVAVVENGAVIGVLELENLLKSVADKTARETAQS